MRKRGAPVVITRKDKRLHKGAHLAAFMLTGGASSVVTAAKATTNAAYNARTRQLMEEASAPARSPRGLDRSQARLTATRHAKQELGVDGLAWRQLSREQKRSVRARARQLLAGE